MGGKRTNETSDDGRVTDDEQIFLASLELEDDLGRERRESKHERPTLTSKRRAATWTHRLESD